MLHRNSVTRSEFSFPSTEEVVRQPHAVARHTPVSLNDGVLDPGGGEHLIQCLLTKGLLGTGFQGWLCSHDGCKYHLTHCMVRGTLRESEGCCANVRQDWLPGMWRKGGLGKG